MYCSIVVCHHTTTQQPGVLSGDLGVGWRVVTPVGSSASTWHLFFMNIFFVVVSCSSSSFSFHADCISSSSFSESGLNLMFTVVS